MALQGWQRQYLAALLTSNTSKIDEYESVEFFSSLVTEPVNGVVELLLHRLIMRLKLYGQPATPRDPTYHAMG